MPETCLVLSIKATMCRLCIVALATCIAACGSQPPPQNSSGDQAAKALADPGSMPWQQVPRDKLASECGLDPDKLNAVASDFASSPVAVVRYGKLCWTAGSPTASGGDPTAEPYHVFSVTKTFSALILGVIAGRTELKDTDYVRDWLSPDEMGVILPTSGNGPLQTGIINPNAKVAHVLAMTSTSPDLSQDKKSKFNYDSEGANEIQRLIPIMDRAVRRSPEGFPGLSSAGEVAVREVFDPLGMRSSYWAGATSAQSLITTVQDMARLGLLLLRKGNWNGHQIVDEDYVYRMTHPSFEDSNTAYGYLTWLTAAGAYANNNSSLPPPSCSPYATWQRYPHPAASESTNNYGGSPFPNAYDIGEFEAVGLGGQIISVHRGLDLVIVTRNDPGTEQQWAWNRIRPALVALDPKYKGDEAAFCQAYQRSAYAPDLISAWDADSGFGPIDDHVDPSVDTDPPPPITGPVGLQPYRNNIGIAPVTGGGANFDGSGGGYLNLFLSPSLAPVLPGGSFTADGFNYTLPVVAAGLPDNVQANGQTIFPASKSLRAKKLGLLGAGTGGGPTGTISINYTDGSVRVVVRMPDWEFEPGLAGIPLTPEPVGTVIALRGASGANLAEMWSVSVPLDSSRELRSVTLPRVGGFHIFDLQLQ